MNRDFNKVIITGYPKEKPELKLTVTGVAVMNFVLKSEGIKNTEYFDVTVWGELAEKIHKSIDTDVKLMVEGTLHRRMKSEKELGGVEINASRIFSVGGRNIEIY